jgi:hypothetical protein
MNNKISLKQKIYSEDEILIVNPNSKIKPTSIVQKNFTSNNLDFTNIIDKNNQNYGTKKYNICIII